MAANEYTGLLSVLYAWQDLVGAAIGALVAGVAVLVSVRALNAAQRQVDVGLRQLNHAREQDEARRRSRDNAMRAALPPVLSEITRWSKEVVNGLRAFTSPITVHERTSYQIPQVGDDVGEALTRMIEATENEVLMVRLSNIIGNMQVLKARLSMIHDLSLGLVIDNIDSFVLDAMVIHAQVGSLFGYSRRQTDIVSVRLSHDLLSNALDTMSLHGGRWENLCRILVDMQEYGKNFEDLHDKG